VAFNPQEERFGMDLETARGHVRRLGQTMYIGTVAPSGYANVTPIAVAWPEGSDYLYAATMASSAKVRDLRRNPKVTLHNLVSEATAYDQVRVRGTAEILQGREHAERFWEGTFDYSLADFFGSPENPDLCFIAITPRRVVLERAMGAGGREEWRASR
jgi:general stress protein 26